jgi:hypothetical protein
MMRWFRTNKRFGGRLALFALAVQIALSFAHIHPDDIYGAATVASDAPIALPAADQVGTLSTDHRSGHVGDYCEICATISLLSTSFVAEAPQLPLHAVFHAVEHVDGIAIVFIAPRRALFQTRAPPGA